MLNNTEGKENKMKVTVTQLFNHMTDEDFMILHEEGQLKSFCDALSIDLSPKSHEKDSTYTA